MKPCRVVVRWPFPIYFITKKIIIVFLFSARNRRTTCFYNRKPHCEGYHIVFILRVCNCVTATATSANAPSKMFHVTLYIATE